MSKYRDHRPSRWGRFDSDQELVDVEPTYFQRAAAAVSAKRPSADETRDGPTPLDAEVVWFDAKKGFGFVRLSDGSEVFLHASKLEAADQTDLTDGRKLQVLVETGSKGKPQVSRVLSLAITPSGARTSQPPQSQAHHAVEEEQPGFVKRYDPERGFGFVRLDNGGGDVFLHATALSRSKCPAPEAGQRVYVRYVQGQKGLEARSVRNA